LAARLARERHVDIEASRDEVRRALAIGRTKVRRIDQNLTSQLSCARLGLALRLCANFFRTNGRWFTGATYLNRCATALHETAVLRANR
jgi:hypothetical protein